jgi:hypothetical protein
MKETEKELLISAFVQDEAGEQGWDRLVALAENDPTLWREVAEAQRDQKMLTTLMARAAAVADTIEAPVEARAAAAPPYVEVRRSSADSMRRLGAWPGWAVAALVLLSWTISALQAPSTRPEGTPPGPTTQLAGFTAQEAFQSYLDKGRAEGTVLSEQPRRVLIQTRPAPSGQGFELIFVQQVMERTIVPNLYRYSGQDEYGRPTLVRWQGPARERM